MQQVLEPSVRFFSIGASFGPYVIAYVCSFEILLEGDCSLRCLG